MKYQIIIFLLILLGGCKKDSQPTQSQSNLTVDDLLKSKIIGQWKCGSAWGYTFNADSTFIAVYSNPSSSTPDTVIYKDIYIAKGKYSINNSIMTFSQMELVYADTTFLLPFVYMTYYIYYPHKVEFKNENLVLNLMDILSPVDKDGKILQGKWETENWIVQIERRPTSKAFFGKIKKEYYFNTDSMKYTLKLTNNYDSPYQVQNDSGTFIYTADRLSFSTHITIPEFVNEKLNLNYISWPIFYYDKVQ